MAETEPREREGAMRSSWLLRLAWSGCVAASLLWNLHERESNTLAIARVSARLRFENDLLYRRWVALQGGVYARTSAQTPANPWLQVADRDVVTTSGVALTLVNPAYMTRQVNELAVASMGSHGHITSLRPLRPQNAADPWEAAALRAFETGADEVVGLVDRADGEHLRLMRPFVTEEACLRCHAAQGYRVGDVRGGISVDVPLTPLRAIDAPMSTRLALAHLGLWGIGLAGLAWYDRVLRRQERARERDAQGLRRSEERYRLLVEQTVDGIFVADAQGRYLDVNHAGAALLGYAPEELLRLSIPDVLAEGEAARLQEHIAGFAGGAVVRSDWRFKRKDGSSFVGEVVGRQLLDGRLQAVVRDVSERKHAEARVLASLREKEVLLKEVHHRVKNNLQVIASMLALQAGTAADGATRGPLLESQSRVRALAMVHEKLYRATDLASVSMTEYLTDLTGYLSGAYDRRCARVAVELQLEEVQFNVDVACPLGLIFTELLSNALRHAFPGGRTGRIVVSLRRSGDGHVTLGVADDGVGFPADRDPASGGDSLGLQLVNVLVTQLGASLRLERSGGSRFEVVIPASG